MTRIALFALALLLVAMPGFAQTTSQPTEVDSLTRVRVSVIGAPKVVGEIVGADARAITVAPVSMDERLVLPMAQVRRLDVSEGRRSTGEGAWRGARRGLLVGVVLSALMIGSGAIIDEQDDCGDCFVNATLGAVILSVPLTAITTGGGALLGAVNPGERWRQVPLPVEVRP